MKKTPGWRTEDMEHLAKLFREMTRERSKPGITRAREDFLELFRELSLSAAKTVLSDWGSSRNLENDAQDVASEAVLILIGQEQKGSGLFSGVRRSRQQLLGYLYQTIWNGAVQRAKVVIFKEAILRNADSGELDGLPDSRTSAHSTRIDFLAAVRKIQATEATQMSKKYPGLSPLAAVLGGNTSSGIPKGVPKRTWQRLLHDSRETLRREMEL